MGNLFDLIKCPQGETFHRKLCHWPFPPEFVFLSPRQIIYYIYYKKAFIYILLFILYIMASVIIVKNIDLDGIQRDILNGAEEGVSAAVQDGVSWIRNDVLLGQEQLGHEDFPDIKPATKKQKARRGEMHVLISTGAYKDSWIGESKGLEGTILGGGNLGYAGKLHKKWKIDELFGKVHSKTTLKIIKDRIKRRL
jgi:hypothetical protein